MGKAGVKIEGSKVDLVGLRKEIERAIEKGKA
jgi:hypothetical protein